MANQQIEIDPTKLNQKSKVILQYLMYCNGSNFLAKGAYELPDMQLTAQLSHSLVCRPSSKRPFQQRWEIVGDKLGFGAFSSVYTNKGKLKSELDLAYSPPKNECPSIIKEIKFGNETGMQIKPKHIVKEEIKTQASSDFLHCKSAFFSPDKGFLIMRQAPGMDLIDFVTLMRAGKLSVTYYDLLQLTRSILSEVHALHKKGIIHRDLKPDNIVANPQDFTAKLIDFSFVKPITFPKQRYNSLRGTPAYIAPECWSTKCVSTASDWFAIGWTLAQLWGDTALSNQDLTIYAAEPFTQLLQFLKKETFQNLFHHLHVPLDAKFELQSILQGLIICDESKRLRGAQALVRVEQLIKDYEQTALPVATMV